MASRKIEIIVELYEHTDYKGRKVVLIEDTPRLSTYNFNDKCSSIRIKRGPDYQEGKVYEVRFYDDSHYGGGRLNLFGPSSHPKLSRPYNFNDVISSVKFTSKATLPEPNPKIPFIVELYEHANFHGRKLTLLENVSNLHTDYAFGDTISSVKVKAGPDYTAGKKVKLCRDIDGLGGCIELGVGEYASLHKFSGFNDVCSSVYVD